ncbi:hypothetical protein [Kurthia sibirica]|uniref:Multidrug ABC transporter ATPase n=1 Tax=Kurthia sibirica TaxID=202750 RepID=A0A2U3AH89_9BACL|nr:hypothetical protein [Kurthia sibirica]PWI23895.1 hypothetical protein DEX24_15305 [Kurthia sibirica]GEK34919.1 hypothetical protein KSI01_24520 [Kurthia sibirica]
MKKKEQTSSGHMTNDMDDVIELGKQMDNMRDEQQLNQDGYIQDPVQYEEANKIKVKPKTKEQSEKKK